MTVNGTNRDPQDLSSISFAQLGDLIEKASASHPSQGGAALTEIDLQKIAHLVTQQITQKTSAEQAEAGRREQIRQQWRERAKTSVAKIVKARTLQALDKISGIKLKDEVRGQIPKLIKEAMAEEEALLDAVSTGAEAKDAVIEDLLEAAAADPEIAAQLISDEVGSGVTADEVDEAADPLAEVLLDEQLGPVEGETKESAMQKRSSVQRGLEQTDPFVRTVLSYRAAYKASAVLHHLEQEYLRAQQAKGG